jgi:hypothetical protein
VRAPHLCDTPSSVRAPCLETAPGPAAPHQDTRDTPPAAATASLRCSTRARHWPTARARAHTHTCEARDTAGTQPRTPPHKHKTAHPAALTAHTRTRAPSRHHTTACRHTRWRLATTALHYTLVHPGCPASCRSVHRVSAHALCAVAQRRWCPCSCSCGCCCRARRACGCQAARRAATRPCGACRATARPCR